MTYEDFLNEVAAGHVYVSGLGVGAGSADITIVGDTWDQNLARQYFYRALDVGDVEILRAQVTVGLRRQRQA